VVVSADLQHDTVPVHLSLLRQTEPGGAGHEALTYECRGKSVLLIAMVDSDRLILCSYWG